MTPTAVAALHSSGYRNDTVRWQAVLARDRQADGAFVYAVRSTRVYCRPSCPSRRPHADKVVFFRTGGDAEGAGYRACRRCRPETGASSDPWVDRIARACADLARARRPLSLEALATRLGCSRYHLQRTFKRIVGITPGQFSEACRLGRVKRRMRAGQDVTTALWEAGYGSSGRFYERAAPKLGMPPTAYRKGGLAMMIDYTIVDSAMGRVLVAATSRGVCAVAMSGSDHELTTFLTDEYPAATVRRATGPLARWTREVLARLEGQRPRADLPIDVQATAFQWQVWRALDAIPRGETRTYGEIAKAIGRPRAIRAVGRACATNPVAVVIPCHRAVGASGAMTGYRWGVERKRELLAREALPSS